MNIFRKIKRLFKRSKEKGSPQDEFSELWKDIFAENAEIFCGLFGGMYKLSLGDMKRKKAVLTEWCARVTNQLDDAAVSSMENTIRPLLSVDDPQKTCSIAEKLINAAEAAGITCEIKPEITITETDRNDYINFEGEEFSPGERVKILAPAWYNGDKILEKGAAKTI